MGKQTSVDNTANQDIVDLVGDILRQRHTKLLGYAMKFTKDAVAATDLLSETALKAVNAARKGTIDPENNVPGYIYTIMRNVWNSPKGDRQFHRHIVDREQVRELALARAVDPATSSDEMIHDRQVKALVPKVLDTLEDRYRAHPRGTSHLFIGQIAELARLRFMERVSQEEAATRLGTNRAQVRTAEAVLKQILRNDLRSLQ